MTDYEILSLAHRICWKYKDGDKGPSYTFDKDTMLHELAHLPKDDAHSDAWANRLWELQETYLNKKESKAAHLEITRYLSGRRLYTKKFGEKPPMYVDQVSIWVNTKPTSK